MIWHEHGVSEGSYMCFFNNEEAFKSLFYTIYSCGTFRCDSQYHVHSKGFRPSILIYVVHGSLNARWNEKNYTAGEGDILLLPEGDRQDYACPDFSEFLFFHFRGKDAGALADTLVNNNNGPLFQGASNALIYAKIKDPIMRLCYEENMKEAALSTLVYETLCLLYESNESSLRKENRSEFIENALNYIQAHIQEPLSVKEVADFVGVSFYYFSRTFKKEIGISPSSYISQRKLSTAKRMLRTTSLSINEIAEHLSYASSASFINAFKAFNGVSPYQFRKRAG